MRKIMLEPLRLTIGDTNSLSTFHLMQTDVRKPLSISANLHSLRQRQRVWEEYTRPVPDIVC